MVVRGLFKGNLDAEERYIRIVWLSAVTSLTAQDCTLKSVMFHVCSVIDPQISVIISNLEMWTYLYPDAVSAFRWPCVSVK